tara:strand:+ start:108 stop:497 length:390 start_codon:yes stop_codon:yes gene_type:complete
MDQKIKNISLAALYLSIAGFFLVLLLTLKDGAELFRQISEAESTQRIELMKVTQKQLEATETLLSSATSFSSGVFLLSEASDFESARVAVSILDGSIQQAKEAEMNNVAVIMEAFKGKILQEMGLAELR